MTKEQIRKRFEFDLNTGVFRSNPYQDGTLVSFASISRLDRWSFVEFLEDIGYNCTTNRNPFSGLRSADIICVNYFYKEYGLYSQYEYLRIKRKEKLDTINNIPNYVSNYLFQISDNEEDKKDG